MRSHRVREQGEAELGYWIGRPHWGLGYATEAACADVASAFAGARVERVVALPLVDNVPSRRVLEKAGLWFVGLCPAEVPWEGREQAVYESIRGAAAL